MRGLFTAELAIRFAAVVIVANHIGIAVDVTRSVLEQFTSTMTPQEGALAVPVHPREIAALGELPYSIVPFLVAGVLWWGRRRIARVAFRVIFAEDYGKPAGVVES